jgi:uncharacterized membrane protein
MGRSTGRYFLRYAQQMILSLPNLRRILIALIALMFLSFVLHEMIPHEHNEAVYGSGFAGMMHGASHRWELLILLSGIAVMQFVFMRVSLFLLLPLPKITSRMLAYHGPPATISIKELFSSGIIHSRVYE